MTKNAIVKMIKDAKNIRLISDSLTDFNFIGSSLITDFGKQRLCFSKEIADEFRGREETARDSQVAEKHLVVDNRSIFMMKKHTPNIS